MCGILVTFRQQKRLIQSLIQELSLRGRDGWGCYSTAGSIKKSLGNVKEEFPDFIKGTIVMANSRAIPTTEFESGAIKALSNQQPFENERYIVIHNGLIYNDIELINKYNLKPSSKVDSAMIPELFSAVGIIEGLKQLKGSFAIGCYDKIDNKIYMAKNFMPLQFIEEQNGFIFISLKEMLPEYLREKAREVEAYTCYEIELGSKFKIKKHNLLNERNKKVLVICSGGIDSVTTAFTYKFLGYEISLLHFTYGQAAQDVEFFSINKIAEILGSKLIVYDARPVFNNFKSVSRLLNNAGADKDTQMLDAESDYSYVPARNAIFAVIAGAVAEMHGIDNVSFGGQQLDGASYPDNNPTFVDAVDNLYKYCMKQNANIHFAAPLLQLIKHEIVELGLKIGVPYEYVCSCYYPKLEDSKIIVCDKCGCCQFRKNAFKMLGKTDGQFPNMVPIEGIDYSKIEDVNKFIKMYVQPFA